jgi:predicted DNA-binding protein
MTLTIELAPEIEQLLNQAAAREGQDPATFVKTAVEEKLRSVHSSNSNSAERLSSDEEERLLNELAALGPTCHHSRQKPTPAKASTQTTIDSSSYPLCPSSTQLCMAYILDTNILLRLISHTDPQHELVRASLRATPCWHPSPAHGSAEPAHGSANGQAHREGCSFVLAFTLCLDRAAMQLHQLAYNREAKTIKTMLFVLPYGITPGWTSCRRMAIAASDRRQFSR